MRFCILQEGDAPPGVSRHERYHQMVEEAVFAEEMGFDVYGLSEQHLNPVGSSVSFPEVLFGYIAARTSRIRLRFMSTILLTFNHPLRVAERVAGLDILSNGRVELATARSNNLPTLQAFGVDPAETRAQWDESLQVIIKAFTEDPFEHHGTYWDIPPVTLVPTPVQTPHPPLFVAATSIETHAIAGERGLGCMGGNAIFGWDYVEACVNAYKSAIPDANPIAATKLDYLSTAILVAHCAEDVGQAREEAAPQVFRFLPRTTKRKKDLAPTSGDYAYMGKIDELEEHKDDLDYLIDCSPYFTIGDPDFLIERFERLAAMGLDEVILRTDGIGHEEHMRSMELIGRHVIPAVRNRVAAGTTGG